ncbi:MAG: hypothetical protein J6I49_03225 [Bacteroidales bacterium]|nr:hypothetical protein [Bacteroidales bacterium]
MEEYEDIIHLPHWEPRRHPRMPMDARAAQFAPFSAVTGVDEAASETVLQHIAALDVQEEDEDWML